MTKQSHASENAGVQFIEALLQAPQSVGEAAPTAFSHKRHTEQQLLSQAVSLSFK